MNYRNPARPRAQDEDDDQPIELIRNTSTQGASMEAMPSVGAAGSRRNEDIALEMMKFIAMTTGYGKTGGGGGAGFTGSGGGPARPEDYATHLLELYGRCLDAVAGKK